ncbi:N-acetyl-anhydromuramyl-L-alanine amidase AmpD [Lacrimispora sphenoides]|uniref:peptidoglycan recognition protein family protein n=1 Tax=Lacrimispora sphenoides TaxID=29370 RepID=UPI0008D37E51|nr:peptidoglycan recognition family protein [Lacrimispora sphenoides]SET80256.1 N-acetyl-anhydromuramyl-L-alanine amidase AmpD [Lacrimispora sphenoides]
MQIKKLLTPYNYSAGTADRIKYIVIHYVGALGGAEANCKYYASQYIGASAHYYVGFSGEVWQSVEEKDIAWHCGAKSYVHPECRNQNSIGIEMCVRNSSGNLAETSRDWYFEDATVKAAIELTKELMAKYNIPADRVIRHHDVTGKICPNPYVWNHTRHTWDGFKAALAMVPVKKSRWIHEDNGWRFYLGDTGLPIRNDWLQDQDKWYWFDGAGMMATSTWYQYKGGWYYLGSDGAMVKGLQASGGKWYYLDEDGKMAIEPVTLTPDQNGALQYSGR